jgi:hypothetical protein
MVDHQALVAILDKYTLDAIENPKLQRMKERLSPYCFTTVWKKGKEHAIPDALSRAPVNDPAVDDECVGAELEVSMRNIIIQTITDICNPDGDSSSEGHLLDILLTDLRKTAAEDVDYMALLAMVEAGFGNDRARVSDYVRQFWAIRHQLSTENGLILFGSRIVVPFAARRIILQKLHSAHQGIVRTKRRAQQTVFWPGISNDVTMLVERCPKCQERLPSQCQEALMSDPLPDFVFEDVSADLFKHGTLHVLVYADRLSGWPVVHQWRRDPTAREVVQAVVHNFVELGVPMRFRSDNGPQFDAKIFQDTLNRWGVAWGNSTPHYHQSNGHAEAAVKAVKELVAKTAPSGDLSSEDFLAGLLEFRNTPHECGLSPAQIVFGHQLRSVIPAHRSSFAPKWKDAIIARERQAAAAADTKLRYDTRTRPLAPISIGTPVRIQDPISKLWSHVGVIVAVGRYRSYRVKFASGSVLWRNRRFIRPMVPAGEGEKRAEPDSPSENGPMCEESGDVIIPEPIQRHLTDPSPEGPRRGTRIRKKKIIVSV